MSSLFDSLVSAPVKSGFDYSAPQVVSVNNSYADGCHNLNITNGRVAMFSAQKTPWHGLGTVIDRCATAAEAIELAALAGWDLQKIQLFAEFNGIRTGTDQWGVMRGDNGAYLGTVGERYTIVSNETCFEMMDDILGASGAHYETAGALGEGQTAWMLAKMPNGFQIKGRDAIDPYLLCSTSHDGTGTIRIAPTMTRVVCQNTHRVAMSGMRGKGISLRHTAKVADRAKLAKTALGMACKSIEHFSVQANQLACTQLEPMGYFAAYLDSALTSNVAGVAVNSKSLADGSLFAAIAALPSYKEKEAAQTAMERAKKRRGEFITDILNRYESDRNNSMPGMAGTAWAAYNTVAEQIDHSNLFRANKDAESRFERVLLGAGDDAKQEAFSRAIEMIAS